MHGFKEKLGDLTWVGYPDLAWIEVEVEEKEVTTEELKEVVDNQIKYILQETNDYVAFDNPNATKKSLGDWMEYRRLIKEIPNQSGYPNIIDWPSRPQI